MIRFLQTPGPVKKIILSAILLVFCGAMVITLIPGGLGASSSLFNSTPGQGVVATVAGEEVTSHDVLKQAQFMVKQQFRGQNSPMAAQLIPYFAGQAADRLVTEKSLVAEAKRMGLKATDQDVRDELQHGQYASYFFPGGNFIGKEAYENLLASNDTTPQAFEQSVKDEILTRKLIALVTGSATVSDKEIHDEFEKRNTKIKFDYAVLSQEDLRKGLNPTDAELKAYYEKNKASYNNSIPEKRKLEYVFLDRSKILSGVQVSDQDLQAYYNQHQDDFRVPEQVKVSHILIKTPPAGPDGKVDDKAVAEAQKKAQDVLNQVKAGGKFDELAKKYSDDPGSAKQGGELGWIGRGRTVPEFEKAAFSLPKGQTSDLVKSSYGFHIIHVEDKQDAHVKSLDEVRAQIEPLVKQQKAGKLVEEQANALLASVRADGFDKAAAAKGLNVVNTDFVSKGDPLPGIGVSPQFMNEAFSAHEKDAPNLAQIPQGFAVYQVEGIKPPATPTFEEIRTRVENEFKNERAQQLLEQKVQELSDRAKAEHDLKRAAKELGATLKTSDMVGPEGQVPDVGAMSGPASAAFDLKPGEISGPISAGASGTSGVVIQVLEKEAPPESDFAAKKDQLRDSLLQNKQQELFGVFVAGLRQQMQKDGKIRMNEDEMKKLTKGQAAAGL
jgi:peptidyl-prolyl cis-trans isomerase D